jgi:mannose-6-phosphate isomerase-like protein (cupin superfamily)
MATTVLAGENVTIGRGQMHRIENTLGHEELEFIEIQCGDCDESDIERFEDDYGRVAA